jgi:hypothetical protein
MQRIAILLAVLAIAPAAWADQRERESAALDARIAGLIDQLGAVDFPTRERAMRELAQIGLPAFDALQEAQYHKDLEVGLRARYLIGSAQVAWSRDDDPPEVKTILKEYGTQVPTERATRIDRLGKLEDRKGWPALCRLARYEREERLAKQAALAIIAEERRPDEEVAEAVKLLQAGAADSRRRASQWLRSYARWLNEPETSLAEWSRLVDEEFKLQGNDQTSPEVIAELGRWHAANLHRLGHNDEARQTVERLASVLEKTPAAVLDHVDWLGHQQMWPYVVAAAEKFQDLFDQDAMLLYRLAEAQRRLGNADSKETAARAFALNSDAPELRLRTGFLLSRWGMFDWCEKEYRALITDDLKDRWGLRARAALAEVLHDQLREREAGEVLAPIAAAIGDNEVDPFGKRQPNEVRRAIEEAGREPGAVLSRMHYFFALDHLSRQEYEKAGERLRQGAEEDSQDADVLIGLFRLPNQTAEQQKETQKLIQEATENFDEQISEYTRAMIQLQAQVPASEQTILRQQLAMANNQYAWLVANTEGDFEAAVAASHESLKLRPGEPAYLDTLGRCYYAAGDLKNAIKYQSEAVRKEPHSGQMARQLAFFKAELEKQRK